MWEYIDNNTWVLFCFMLVMAIAWEYFRMWKGEDGCDTD